MKPWVLWAAGGAAGVGGVYVYHKHQAAKSAAAQQQNQSQTQAAPITTIPYAVGLNYGNGYSGGSRHGAQGKTGPAGPAGPAGTTSTVVVTGTTGTTGAGTQHWLPVLGGTYPASWSGSGLAALLGHNWTGTALSKPVPMFFTGGPHG